MKKYVSVFTSLLLALSLAACGGEEAVTPFDPAKDARTLLETPGVFGETLTEIDGETACSLYGIDPDTVESCAVYGATATSAEELAIFLLKTEEDAGTAAQQLRYRVEDRIDGLKDYLPDEIPSLEDAVVEVRGNSVLLVVADDYGPVQDFLGQ